MASIKDKFLPHNQSLKLRELGFNEPCITWWWTTTLLYPESQKGSGWFIKGIKNDNKKLERNLTMFPEYQHCTAICWMDAFEWFYKEYGLVTTIQNSLSYDDKVNLIDQLLSKISK